VDLEDVGPALRERLGPGGTYALVALLTESGKEVTADVLTMAGERFERRLAEETSRLRVDMAQGFAALRREIVEGHAALRQEILNQRFEILKWAFLFWAGQFAAFASLIGLVIRFVRP
jgi:hypothetical protein